MKILLAIDQSPDSMAAVRFLTRLRFPPGSSLFLLHVVEVPFTTVESSLGISPQARRELDGLRAQAAQAAKAWMKKVEARITGKNLRISSLVVEGEPAFEVARAIERNRMDLAVLGTRGLSGPMRFLLGSVSEQTLLQAPCSVLVVRDRSRSGAPRRTAPLRVVLAVDASPDAAAAARLLAELAMPRSARVTLLHIVEQPDALTSRLLARGHGDLLRFASDVLQARKDAGRNLLEQVQNRLRSAGFRVDAVLAKGDPAPQIIRAAQQQRAGLVVLGSRGLTGVQRLLMGSVSRKVARYAPCSVLVVRSKR